MESHSISLAMQTNAGKPKIRRRTKPFTVACRLSEKDFEQLAVKMSLQKKTTQEFLEKLILNYLNNDYEQILRNMKGCQHIVNWKDCILICKDCWEAFADLEERDER